MTRHLRRYVAAASVLLGALPAAAIAQQATTISGRVTSDAAAPLPGVSVSIPTLGAGAYTDDKGHYSFTVPSTRAAGQAVQLTARRIGYTAKTVTVTLSGAAITQDFSLGTSATQLTGVVVSALGATERPKSQLGAAVTQLSTEELNGSTHEQNIMQQVEGKVAGVRITSPGTQGGNVNIVIRGQNSLTGSNQPLFVVDGIPVSNASRGGSVGSGRDYGSTISDINPEDIESMTVLKGPNAAALYGSRASNGVIVLTTKKGKSSTGRIRTDFTSSLTFENPSRLWDFQNQYGQGSGGSFAFVNGAGAGDCDGCDQSFGPKLDGRLIHQFTDGTDTTVKSPWIAHPNNVRDFFNTGRTFSTTAAASGGTDRLNGRVSIGADDINGMIPNNRFTKFSTMLSGQFQVNDRLNTSATAQYVRNTGLNRPGVGYSNSILEQFFWFGRQVDLNALRNYQQTSLANSPNGNREFNWNYNFHSNPFWLQAENPVTDGRDRIIGSVSATYKLADGVNATLRSGSDIYRYNINTQSAYAGPGASLTYNGAMSITSDYFNENNTDLIINGNRSLGHGITVNATVGGNTRRNQSSTEAQSTSSLLVAGLYNISNSAIAPTVSQSISRRATNSVFGSAAFTLNDWWTVEGTARNDWSSTLPEGANSYFYPSVNTSVVLTDAIPSLKNSVLSFAKVRGSVAQVGNDASPYQLATTFSGVSAKFNGQPQYSLGDQLANAALKPEITRSIEYGTELGMWDSRVTLDATVYQNQTKNQILSATVSAASGFTSKSVNAGRIDNKGYEALLTLIPVRKNRLEWTTAVNFAHNHSTVAELAPGISQIQLGGGLFSDARTVAALGQPYGQIQVRGYMRDSATGAIMTSKGLPLGTTNYLPMGNLQAKWTGGWNNTLTYRGVTVGALVDVRHGGNIVSYTNSVGESSGQLASSLKGREIDWNNPGIVVHGTDRESCGAGSGVTATGMYRCVGGGTANSKNVNSEAYFQALFQNMEPYVYDASYVKLREVRVGFDLPSRWASRFNANAVNVALIGRNLGLWTKVPNIDPEFAYSNGNAQGIEYGVVPNARSVGFNLRVTP
jgi:TonB-linked SusC/RagA family outer membrane protein